MIHKINFFFTKAFNVILAPFDGVNDFWPVLVISVALSFIILWILKYISFPNKIVEAKDKIKANIFAIRIYKDFWKVILTSFFKSLFHTMRYFVFNFAPFLIIIPLLSPVFSQMEARYGLKPFKTGDTIIVKAGLEEGFEEHKISLLKNGSFKQKMNPVFINAWKDEEKTLPLRVANWKLVAEKGGESFVEIKIDDKIFRKSLIVGRYNGALSDRKYRDSNLNHFLYPVEDLIEKNAVLKSVAISYPGKLINFLGIKMHWILWNLIIVVVVILAFRKRFGVEF